MVRKAIIAQVIPGNKIFLMDGLANLGNSGSPVVSLTSEKPKLLGIVQGSYNYGDPPRAIQDCRLL